jgi:hypothetical protein
MRVDPYRADAASAHQRTQVVEAHLTQLHGVQRDDVADVGLNKTFDRRRQRRPA